MTFFPRAGQCNDGPRTTAALPLDDRCTLTPHMERKYRRTLGVAITLAKETDMIEGNGIAALMNLLVNPGLEHIRNESLR